METGRITSINQEYKKVEKIEKPVQESKEETKVERIKREIDAGIYKIDINKTANLIAKSLI